MAELQKIQELLTTRTGTEGSLLIVRTIADTLFEDVEAMLVGRNWAAQIFGPADIPGSSIDINREDENSMEVELVAEGAEIPLGQPAYSSFNVKPKKYGIRPLITREMLEDGKFNLIQHSLKRAAAKLAENETSLIVSDGLDQAANTVAGGAAITIANITTAMQNLEDSSYKPSVLFVGPEVMNDLRNIDTFAEADKFGSREMQERGTVGRLYGLQVVMVSTDGLTGYTGTSAYVVDPDHAFVLAEKRPVTVEQYDDVIHDMRGAVITQRIAVAALRTNAIAKITTT